jgi:subtilisin family serine protease
VIAATAVDDQLAIYDRATHGDYITLSAPGVGLQLAAINGKTEQGSGTSYAVPFVVAAVAAEQANDPSLSPEAVRAKLEASAKDLGPSGFDPIFGAGLVRLHLCDGPVIEAKAPEAGVLGH